VATRYSSDPATIDPVSISHLNKYHLYLCPIPSPISLFCADPFLSLSSLFLSAGSQKSFLSLSHSVSLSLWNPRPIALPAYTRSVPSCPVFSLVTIMATPTLPRNKLSSPLTFSPVRPLAWACPLFSVTSCDCALVGSSIRAPDSPPSLLLFAYCLMCWEVVPFFFCTGENILFFFSLWICVVFWGGGESELVRRRCSPVVLAASLCPICFPLLSVSSATGNH
jgi:hypothetical protein